MTPSLFAKKASDLWERNSCGVLSVTSYEGSARRMKLTLSDIEGFDFISLVAGGFVLYALEAVGCAEPKASFAFDDAKPAPRAVDYELTWQ
jgi:hypothetical protein